MRLFNPIADDEGQIWPAVTMAYREVAVDLGGHYDAKLSSIDSNWLVNLQAVRRNPASICDPYFVFDEPLRYRDSIVRRCLPPGDDSVFWAAMQGARRERNHWFHNERPATLENAIASMKPIRTICDAVGLGIAADVIALDERLQAIKAGNVFHEAVDANRLRDFAAELQHEQTRRAALEVEMSEAYERALAADQARRQEAERAMTVEQAHARLLADHEVALRGWGEATAMLEAIAERLRLGREAEISRVLAAIPEPQAMIELPDGLSPGDPWPSGLPRGQRMFSYRAAHRDFLDAAEGRWLSEGVNDHALGDLAAELSEVLDGRDCDLLVNHCGHLVGLNWPEWGDETYLGSMDPAWLQS